MCADVLWVILGVYSVKSGSNYKLSCFMKLCPLSGGKYLFKFETRGAELLFAFSSSIL